jgi:RecQ family ATP-dependent DNA helicase
MRVVGKSAAQRVSLAELAAGAALLVDELRAGPRSGAAFPSEQIEKRLGLDPRTLDDDGALAHLQDAVRLAGGAIEVEQGQSGWHLRASFGGRLRDVGDALAGLRRTLERQGPFIVNAATVARWCERDGSARFPEDLLARLLEQAPAYGVEIDVPPGVPLLRTTPFAFRLTPPAAVPQFVPLKRSAPPAVASIVSLEEGDPLRRYPVFPSYRSDEQRDLVHAMLADGGPHEILGVLPTGGGKSFTFLLPTLVKAQGGKLPGLTLVISPIIALMNDQVAQARRRYLPQYPSFRVEQLNSSLLHDERREVLRALRAGHLHLLYLSPETLLQPWFLHTLLEAEAPIRFFVVDEAHMVREWGEDFRCDFQRLGTLREELFEKTPTMRTLLLSATMTSDTRAAVLDALRIDSRHCLVIEKKALRTELHYEVRCFRHGIDKSAALLNAVQALPRPGIIYCTRKATCDELYALLEKGGLRAMRVYNGDTPRETRSEVLREFQAGLADVVIATNAFGLGVDKGNVRYVLHYQVPDNLDRYYQEVGRAGRDGEPARALLFFSGEDMGVMRRQAVARLETAKIVSRFVKLWSVREALPSWQGRRAAFSLINDTLVPEYNLASQGPGAPAEQEGHNQFWNHVALNFLERAGLLRIAGTALRKISGRLTTAAATPVSGVTRALFDALQAGVVLTATLARSTNAELRDIERALFRAVRDGQVEVDTSLTGTVVELVGGAESHELEAALTLAVDAHRLDEKSREAAAVARMSAMARGDGCRERHFAELYGYPPNEPGCGRCDQCLIDQQAQPAVETESRRERTMEQEIRERVGELLGWYQEYGRPSLAGGIADALLEELDRQCGDLQARAGKSPEVEVAFLGATTVGKSTVINALLGERLLPMMVVGSTTAARVVLRYGATRRITVHYKQFDNIKTCLSRLREEWDRGLAIEADGGDTFDAESLGLNRLQSIARNLYNFSPNHVLQRSEVTGALDPNLVSLLGTSREITRDFEAEVWNHVAGRYWAIVDNVVIELPHPLLQGGLVIVDLPGTGDIDEGHLGPTREFIAKADQFVLVLGPDCITAPVKQMLVEYELLVSLLQKNRAPMVVLGTRLDLAGEARPAMLERHGLSEALTGSAAVEALWRKKAEASLRELMRPLAARRLQRLPDEAESTFSGRVDELLNVRFCLDRATFQPTNPRAALDLDPATVKDATERQLDLWKEKYPNPGATGIPAAREALARVAAARREEYWTSVRMDVRRLHRILFEKVDYAKKNRKASDTTQALEQLGQARSAALTQLSELWVQLARRFAEWRTTFLEKADGTRARIGKSGAATVRQHLNNKNAMKIRASARDPRNGVYNEIHVPNAIFGQFAPDLANAWGTELADHLRRTMGALQAWRDTISAAMDGVLDALDAPCAQAVRPSVDTARELLGGTLQRVGAVVESAHERAGRQAPHSVTPEAQRLLTPFCSRAIQMTGAGVTQQRITLLADCTAQVGDAVTQAVQQQVFEALGGLQEILRQDVFAIVQAGAQGVFDDLERLLTQIGSGSIAVGASDGKRRLEEALARLPVWEPEPASASPASLAGAVLET